MTGFPTDVRLSLFDRFVGVFRPQHLVQRAQAKLVSHIIESESKRAQFKAAETNRLNDNWRASGGDINQFLRTELRTMRNRSRWLVRNNPHAAATMNAYVGYVIGRGMEPQATVAEDPSGAAPDERFDEWNEKAEALFAMWARSCDVSGSTLAPESFADCQDLFLRKVVEDGETFVHFVVDRSNPVVPLGLEFIEPESLDESVTNWNGNPVDMGVELDKRTHRPVAYHVVGGTNSYQDVGDRRRIPASRMLHAFKRHRPHQHRGYPGMAAVAQKFFQLDEFVDAELIANKIGACFSVFVTSPPGAGQQDILNTQNGVTDSDGNTLSTVQPGIIGHLPNGASVNMLQPQRPGATFGMFTEYILRTMGAGAVGGISYEAISRDTSKSTYASGRMSQQMDYQTYRAVQDWVKRKLCAPVWRKFVDLAILEGRLEAPTFYDVGIENKEFWLRHEWIPAGWPTGINPVQETAAARESMRAGLTTLAQECAQYGRDWKSNLRMISRIQKMAEDLGIVLTSDGATPTVNGLPAEYVPGATPAAGDADA